MKTLSLTPQAEASLDELLIILAEIEHGSRFSHLLRLTPSNDTPLSYLPNDDAIDLFEQWQDADSESAKSDPVEGQPTPFQLDCLKLLPRNIHVAEMARRLGVTFWHASSALVGLERIGLVTRLANRRHWPTEQGFALIGLAPTPAPRHPNRKAGQSVYFGKGNFTPPKPKAALPQNITITESSEGFFININGATLDVPFDSHELARRGVAAWLATKPNRKGLADYFKRKRAALFQFVAEA